MDQQPILVVSGPRATDAVKSQREIGVRMAGRPSYGWKAFAGILLMVGGAFNIIDGLTALTRSNYYQNLGSNQFPITNNYNTWGWIILIVGVLLFLAGIGLFGGATWARVIGILFAGVNAILQLAWLAHFPLWSFTMILVDVLVIYGIAVHGGKEDEAFV
jgi:hypothetical protein